MTAMNSFITFVNHASVIFSHKNIRLMTDPWIFGNAFNNGWSLLSESKFTIEDFDKITHIWFSHEHPDHFHPLVLKTIIESGIDNFDFASIKELQTIKEIHPKGKCFYMNTIKSREDIKEAYYNYGIKIFEVGNNDTTV